MMLFYIGFFLTISSVLLVYDYLQDKVHRKKSIYRGIVLLLIGILVMSEGKRQIRKRELEEKQMEWMKEQLRKHECRYCGGFGCNVCKGPGYPVTRKYLEEIENNETNSYGFP